MIFQILNGVKKLLYYLNQRRISVLVQLLNLNGYWRSIKDVVAVVVVAVIAVIVTSWTTEQ